MARSICISCNTVTTPDKECAYPLCPDCKKRLKRLLGSVQEPTEECIRREIAVLRGLKNSIFFEGWLLYKLRTLQKLVCNDDAELELVCAEADNLYYRLCMGKGCLPGIYCELASFYSDAAGLGGLQLAEEITYEAIAMLNSAELLHGVPPNRIAHYRIACFIQLSEIYGAKGDIDREKACKEHARVYLRDEIGSCLKMLNRLGDGK